MVALGRQQAAQARHSTVPGLVGRVAVGKEAYHTSYWEALGDNLGQGVEQGFGSDLRTA